MFAPTIFIGAMLGGAVGAVEHHFFPGVTATIGTFALVGIGTLFAGFLRTPITSVFMVIELSGNYTAILPVMISTMIAYVNFTGTTRKFRCLICWRARRVCVALD